MDAELVSTLTRWLLVVGGLGGIVLHVRMSQLSGNAAYTALAFWTASPFVTALALAWLLGGQPPLAPVVLRLAAYAMLVAWSWQQYGEMLTSQDLNSSIMLASIGLPFVHLAAVLATEAVCWGLALGLGHLARR